jgi:hypothetical protein
MLRDVESVAASPAEQSIVRGRRGVIFAKGRLDEEMRSTRRGHSHLGRNGPSLIRQARPLDRLDSGGLVGKAKEAVACLAQKSCGLASQPSRWSVRIGRAPQWQDTNAKRATESRVDWPAD